MKTLLSLYLSLNGSLTKLGSTKAAPTSGTINTPYRQRGHSVLYLYGILSRCWRTLP